MKAAGETTTKSGYCNGSDMLLYVNGQAAGHCSTHTTTLNSETKDHSVKPVATKGLSSGLWKGKTVTGLSIAISAEGFNFYDETECGYKELYALWLAGKPVEVKCMEREDSDTPYLVGNFIISSLERVDPAQDDSTYSLSLDNADEPSKLDPNAITQNDAPAAPDATAVVVDPATASVAAGEKKNISASVDPAGADQTLDVSSSDETIATVALADDKKSFDVTGIKAGTAEIDFAAHSNSKITGKCAITVTPAIPPAPTGVKVDKTDLSVAVGAKGNVVASVDPAGADQTLDVSTSDDKTATVALSSDKKSYEVTGVKAGTATITFASHADATKTATTKVTVTAAS